jgi:hypothetical protein
VSKNGYSNNLGGNYFSEGQTTDYEELVKKFPEFFVRVDIVEEQPIKIEKECYLTIEQETADIEIEDDSENTDDSQPDDLSDDSETESDTTEQPIEDKSSKKEVKKEKKKAGRKPNKK